MPVALALSIDVSPLIGPAFIGLLLNWCLLGVLCTQVQSYHMNYHHVDRLAIRVLVYAMLLIEVFFTIGLTHGTYALCIKSWGNPLALGRLPWTVSLITPSSAISGLAVQCFFAWRIWMLTRHMLLVRLLSILVVLFSLVQFAGALGFTIVFATRYKLFLPVVRIARPLIILANIWLVGSFATDLLIAVMMVWVLHRTKKTARMIKRTEDLISRLILNSVATGVVTAVVALMDVFLYMLPSMTDNNYYAICAFTLGKLYSTMLLANLNGRNHFDGGSTSYSLNAMRTDGTIGDLEMQNPRRNNTSGVQLPGQRHAEVYVTTNIDKFVSSKGGSKRSLAFEEDHK